MQSSLPTRYFDIEGKEITFEDWQKLFEDIEYRRVMSTNVSEDIWVSTVWTGVDYGMSPYGKKQIFESAVFEKDDASYDDFGYSDLWVTRFETKEEAEEGHKENVLLAQEQAKMAAMANIVIVKEPLNTDARVAVHAKGCRGIAKDTGKTKYKNKLYMLQEHWEMDWSKTKAEFVDWYNYDFKDAPFSIKFHECVNYVLQ